MKNQREIPLKKYKRYNYKGMVRSNMQYMIKLQNMKLRTGNLKEKQLKNKVEMQEKYHVLKARMVFPLGC